MTLAWLALLAAPLAAERVAPPSCQELQIRLCGSAKDPGKCLRTQQLKLPLRCRAFKPQRDGRLVEPSSESSSLDKSAVPRAPEGQLERGEVKEVLPPDSQEKRLRLGRFRKTPDSQR